MWNTLKRIGVWVSQLFEPTLWELRIFAAEHALNNAVAEVAELRAELAQAEIELADKAFYVREFAAVSAERDALNAEIAQHIAWQEAMVMDIAHVRAERDAFRAKLKRVTDHNQTITEGYKAEIAALRERASVPTIDQVEALARVLKSAYESERRMPQGYCCIEDWPPVARVAIAHLAKRPEGLLTAEELWRLIGSIEEVQYDWKGIEYIELEQGDINNLLTALRPWLRDPVGFELDVTWKEVQAAYYRHQSGSPEGQCWHQVIELIRSRISPVYECKECDQWRKDWDSHSKAYEILSKSNSKACKQINTIRAALEGE